MRIEASDAEVRFGVRVAAGDDFLRRGLVAAFVVDFLGDTSFQRQEQKSELGLSRTGDWASGVGDLGLGG